MKVFENHSLTHLNTLKLSSVCNRYIELHCEQDLVNLLASNDFDRNNFFILGEGSNVILPASYSGTVLKPAFLGFQKHTSTLNSEKNNTSDTLKVGAGESWSTLINYCLDNDLIGVENLTLIPGSVGAAPVQNIGAYGVEVCELIESVEVFNFVSEKIETLSNKDCQFSYRDSIFKRKPNTYLLISINFIFNKSRSLQTSYASLAKLIEEKSLNSTDLSARDVSQLIASIRQERLPDPATTPNVGSFFKNPIVTADVCETLKVQFPNLVIFPYGNGLFKLSAAWLIEYCGWKGKGERGLKVSEKHALVVVNESATNDGVTREIVLSFAGKIQKDVKGIFSVDLEIEPVLK